MDLFDPFGTVFRELDSRGDQRDPRAEALALDLRNQLIAELIGGEGYLDTTLDCLAEQGINPDAWLDQTTENLEWAIGTGQRFTSNDYGILLPEITPDEP